MVFRRTEMIVYSNRCVHDYPFQVAALDRRAFNMASRARRTTAARLAALCLLIRPAMLDPCPSRVTIGWVGTGRYKTGFSSRSEIRPAPATNGAPRPMNAPIPRFVVGSVYASGAGESLGRGSGYGSANVAARAAKRTVERVPSTLKRFAPSSPKDPLVGWYVAGPGPAKMGSSSSSLSRRPAIVQLGAASMPVAMLPSPRSAS